MNKEPIGTTKEAKEKVIFGVGNDGRDKALVLFSAPYRMTKVMP